MSKNIDQVYIANPITSNASTDLMYFGQSPYGVGNDAAMTYANFSAQFGAPYTAAALTKTDDTNVTLTLGGSPTTALINAASITAGWTGTLSGTRGGTGVNNGASTFTIGGNFAMSGAFTFAGTLTGNTAVTYPTSGTLATTSQIPTGAALTEVNDTNVTLTLGGSPTTALVNAASITAGWTGSLAVGRGGLGITTTPTNGQIPIGNGTNYTAASITAGSGITITPGAGSITIAASGGSSPWSAGTGTGSAIGGASGNTAGGNYSLVWGNGSNSSVPNDSNIFIFGTGNSSSGNNQYSLLFGHNGGLAGNSNGAFAFGNGPVANANFSFTFGNSCTTNGNYCVAFGLGCTTSSNYGWAIGNSATSTHAGSVVWGDSNSTPNGDSTSNQFNLTFANGYRLFSGGTLLYSSTTAGSSIRATNTNDNAATGYVGEFVSSVVLEASAVSFTTNTNANVTSISLTAGDWDVWGNVSYDTSVGASTLNGWTNSSSATLPDYAYVAYVDGAGAVTVDVGISVPYQRYSLSTTTTIYLSGFATFGTGTCKAYGTINARRAR